MFGSGFGEAFRLSHRSLHEDAGFSNRPANVEDVRERDCYVNAGNRVVAAAHRNWYLPEGVVSVPLLLNSKPHSGE
jgi:hypothetical protein